MFRLLMVGTTGGEKISDKQQRTMIERRVIISGCLHPHRPARAAAPAPEIAR